MRAQFFFRWILSMALMPSASISLISAPAEKTPPTPTNTQHLTPLESHATSNISASLAIRSLLNAFRCFGRLRDICITPSSGILFKIISSITLTSLPIQTESGRRALQIKSTSFPSCIPYTFQQPRLIMLITASYLFGQFQQRHS